MRPARAFTFFNQLLARSRRQERDARRETRRDATLTDVHRVFPTIRRASCSRCLAPPFRCPASPERPRVRAPKCLRRPQTGRFPPPSPLSARARSPRSRPRSPSRARRSRSSPSSSSRASSSRATERVSRRIVRVLAPSARALASTAPPPSSSSSSSSRTSFSTSRAASRCEDRDAETTARTTARTNERTRWFLCTFHHDRTFE